ncbi:MAG: carbohydrate ABC transporter permease [Sphingopyxis sp.]|nr:carbohydrate ABC transporter permease [Sphingopyxis sp.]
MRASLPRHLLLVTSTFVVAAPFVWMLLLSLMPPELAGRGAVSLAIDPNAALANYHAALTQTPLPRFLLNGAIVCIGTLASQIAFGAPLAFALAKGEFAGRRIILALVMIALLLPREVLSVPLFFLCYQLGVLDSYMGLILPGMISPTAIFLLYQVFRTIPEELVDAARIDGLSNWTIIWRLMVPMAAPTLAAIAILTVVGRWNDLFWPTIAITSTELMPPPLGILAFRDEEAGTAYGPLMAATLITTAPLVIAFLLAQKRFIDCFAGARAR